MKEPSIPGSKTLEIVTGLLPKNADRTQNGERTPSPGQHPLATDKEACTPQICSVPNLVLSDDAKETVRFVCYSGGEEDAVGEWQKIP